MSISMTLDSNIIFPDGLLLKDISQYFTTDFDPQENLTFSESLIVSGAIPKRVVEFKTGRFCARKALSNFLNDQPEILQGKGREPLWPEGFIGSISHSSKLAGAVVARRADLAAIGMDIEHIDGVKQNMFPLIFNHSEQELIRSTPNPTLWATLFFSLKESFYKLQYPLTGEFLDFTDIAISTINNKLYFTPSNPLHNLSAIDFNNIQTEWTVRGDQLVTLCYQPFNNRF